uniref:Homeobox domain-containing protein n=1 Tax=Caenorhabditis tropicalis TaxID=1561998 RepID=A0A1I7UGQ0_9PELO
MARIKNVPLKVPAPSNLENSTKPPDDQVQTSSQSEQPRPASLSTPDESCSMSSQSSPESEPIRSLDFLHSVKPPLLYPSSSEPVSRRVSRSPSTTPTLPTLYSTSHPEYAPWITEKLMSMYQPGTIPDLPIRIKLEEQTGLNRRQIYSWYRRKRKAFEKKKIRDGQFNSIINKAKSREFLNACFKRTVPEVDELAETTEEKEEDDLYDDEDELQTAGTLLSLKNCDGLRPWDRLEVRSRREHPTWITNKLLARYIPGIMPSLSERKELADETGLLVSKVSNWFRHKNRSEEDKEKKRKYMRCRRIEKKGRKGSEDVEEKEEEEEKEEDDLNGVVVFGRTLSTDIENVTDF